LKEITHSQAEAGQIAKETEATSGTVAKKPVKM
jgi:hypothetical protein